MPRAASNRVEVLGRDALRFMNYITQSCPNNSLNLLKPRLMQSRTAVVIPFDHRILFVRLLNRTKLSRRLPEIAQTLDAISGIYFRLLWRRLDE